MSLKKGNELFKLEKYEEAINEYKKIDTSSPLYKYVQFNIELARKRGLTVPSQGVDIALAIPRPDKQIGYYRIIGNSIGDLHVNDQAYTNLMHIVQHETMFEDVDKWFIINRLVNKNDQNKVIDYLREHNLNYEIIDFDLDEYKKIGYEFAVLPDSSFWFSKKNNWTNLTANTAVRKLKNAYLMNNNGARNFALQHGKSRYVWTMPWDGNCFLSNPQFYTLKTSFEEEGPFKYVCTPMERVIDNENIKSTSIAENAVEEPQIAFRYDAKECFNEDMVYGNKPKVELFKRLDYPGKWDEYKKLYPWELFAVEPSTEAGQYTVTASVFRLSAGNAAAAESGSTRSHLRAQGIIETIDEVECLSVQKRIKSVSYKNMLKEFLVTFLSPQEFTKIKTIDYSKIESQKERLFYVLYAFTEGLLSDKIAENINTDFEINYENFDIQNLNVFINKFCETLTALIAALSSENFHTAVKIKLELAMMFYYYFSHKTLEFSDEELEYFMNVVTMLFEEIFCYDIATDLTKVQVEHSLTSLSSTTKEQNVHGTFLSKRSDGFGERMRSLLNAMALAEYYQTDFKFQWEERKAGAKLFHSVISKEETFKQSFLEQHCVDDLNSVIVKDVSTVEPNINALKEEIYFNVQQNTYNSKNPLVKNAFASVNFRKLFEHIEFSNDLEFARNAAKKVQLDGNTVAVHLRAGDIVYGHYRYTDRVTGKALPYPVALMLIEKLKEMGMKVLLFGQDKQLCHWLSDHQNIKYADDYSHLDFTDEQQSMFEIALMSRCKKVYGGSSGFSILATMIGDIERIDPKQIFSDVKAVKASLGILKKHINNDFIPPLQVAYACNWLLSKGQNILTDDDYLYLTNLGSGMDPSNQMFTFLKAWKLYSMHRFDEAEQFIQPNMNNQDAPFVQYLNKAYVSKDNIQNFVPPFIKVFKSAEEQGYPMASALMNVTRKGSQENSNCIFYSKRWDGFGERVRSLLNSMALADYYNTGFKFFWGEMGNATNKEFHTVMGKEKTFKRNFLEMYHQDIDSSNIKDINTIDFNTNILEKNLYISVHQNSYRSDNLLIKNAFASVDYRKLFNKIEFSDELELARQAAENTAIDSNTVAMHLRAGDIVYGKYRLSDKYTTKVMPYTVAVMLIDKFKAMGKNVLLFGQDKELCCWLRDYENIKYADDFSHQNFTSEQKSIFEIALMSRCSKVYGGSSGFAILATMIGGIERIDPKQVFETKQAIGTSIEILKKHYNKELIPPLQVAYACNWLLSKGKNILSDDDYLYLTDLGSDMDSSNQMFTFLKAWKLYSLNRFEEAEQLIVPNMSNQETTFAQFLTIAYGPKHKLELFTEKYLNEFDKAAKEGNAAAAAVSSTIRGDFVPLLPQSDSLIFNHVWDVTCNLGIKCNMLSISRDSGIRYFSSPFDNIDTVEGLAESGQLLAAKFSGYFDDINEWRIKNYTERGTGKVLTKILWHKDTPNVYYPHFNEKWLSGEGMTADALEAWKSSKELDLAPVFGDLKKLFSVRQQRLVKLLENGVDLLFIRVDERRSLRRIVSTNEQNILTDFINKVNKAYPKSNVKLLYFYCDTDGKRKLNSTNEVECILIPERNGNEDDRQFVIKKLKDLKIKPRENLFLNGLLPKEK